MEEAQTLKELLNEALNGKGYDIDKLSELTGVPERFVSALTQGDYKVLPAAPYVKGYVLKIAKATDYDSDSLWRAYERENPPLRSGNSDRLPGNRYTIKHVSKKTIYFTAAIAVFVIYGATNADRIIGSPKLQIRNPVETSSVVAMPTEIISGTLSDPNDTVSINGQAIITDEWGGFKKEIKLSPGPNTFEVVAKRFLGREKRVTLVITLTPPAEPPLKQAEPVPENVETLPKNT